LEAVDEVLGEMDEVLDEAEEVLGEVDEVEEVLGEVDEVEEVLGEVDEVEEVLGEVDEVLDEVLEEDDEDGSECCDGSGQMVSLGGVYIRSSPKWIDLSNVNTLRGGASLENVPLPSSPFPSLFLKPIGKPLSST